MTLVRITDTGRAELSPEAFRLERELEEAIAASPSLASPARAARSALVRRQVSLPDGTVIDILLVDETGMPIVVETKLARNGQSRREVVGQVVDYVSLLTSMTVDELDQSVDGALEKAIRSLVDSRDDAAFERLWRAVGVNLRAGAARYVIALDEAPAELERIVRYLVLRSNLNIALVTLTKYREPDGCILIIPQHVVARAEPQDGDEAPPSAELQAVLDIYNASALQGLRTRGRSSNYRQVRPPTWPGGLHYEFLKYAQDIGVELHIESDAGLPAAAAVSAFAGHHDQLPAELMWDPSRSRGRLFLRIPVADPAMAAAAMTALIELTHDGIFTAIAKSDDSPAPVRS